MTLLNGSLSRLWLIETRRNVGVWLLAPMVALAWLVARGDDFLLWVETSVTVRNAVTFAGPFIGGAAAWMAGRDRRRGLDDLLATTPRPALSRQLAIWAATVAWGLLAYAVFGAYVVALTAARATWGAPVLWPMLVGLLALPAHGAIGFALGRYLPSRFTAPLVAIGLFFAQGFIGAGGIRSIRPRAYPRLGWVEFLSPTAQLDASVWYGVRPDLGLSPVLFLLGLTGLALGSLALRDRRNLGSWTVLLAAGLLTAIGMARIADNAPHGGIAALRSMHNGRPVVESTLIPYESVCSADPLPVCVHPAYRPTLSDRAAAINRIAAPLVGLPGAPTRAEQHPLNAFSVAVADGTLVFDSGLGGGLDDVPWFAGAVTFALTHNIALTMPGRPSRLPCPGGDPRPCLTAQDALQIWLMWRAGYPVAVHGRRGAPILMDSEWEAASAAAERFAALDPARQREWLSANYAALRRGEIRLEDLP